MRSPGRSLDRTSPSPVVFTDRRLRHDRRPLHQPDPAERLSWSWSRARRRIGLGAAIGVGCGVLFGLVLFAIGVPLNLEQLFWPGFGLMAGTIIGLAGGLTQDVIPPEGARDGGVRRSARNGCLSGLFGAAVAGVFVGGAAMAVLASITLPALAAAAASGLVGGAVLGLIFGVTRGLGAAVQNLTLRLLLAAYRVAPLHYPRWLDHAVDLRLLYRGANGGYLFIHRMVQDYFGRRSAPPDLMPRPGVGVITGLR